MPIITNMITVAAQGMGDSGGGGHGWPDASDPEHLVLARQVGWPSIVGG